MSDAPASLPHVLCLFSPLLHSRLRYRSLGPSSYAAIGPGHWGRRTLPSCSQRS